MKSNHTIEATHPAYGTVTFTIPAEDAKQAFSLWKQIVFSSRQWMVKRNETGAAAAGRVPHKAILEAVDPEFS
jgi:hypothetical protein